MSKDDLEQLKRKALKGDKKALNKLINELYNKGDYRQTVKWLHEAERQHNKLASYFLAVEYERGRGTEQNYGEAIKRYRRLESIQPEARYKLAKMYEEGRGVEQNYCEAISRYLQIESKYPQAQYTLGLMYEGGLGVEKDIAKALDMYRKASPRVPDAQAALKRVSSMPAKHQNTNDAVANLASVASATQVQVAAPVISNAEQKTSEQIHSPLHQSDATTAAQAQPMSPKPESRQALSDEKTVYDADVRQALETTQPLENPGDNNPLPEAPNRDTTLADTTLINVDGQEQVNPAKQPIPSTQWEYHEPPKEAKWPKPHLHRKADMDAGLFLARRRGRSHEHDAKFCDDDGDFWRHNSGWTVLAVADGAGSAEYSREGSRIAVTTVIDEFARWFTDENVAKCNANIVNWEQNHAAFHQLFYIQFFEICKKAIAKIKSLAEQHNLKERQFATTLLVTVSKTVLGKTYLASLWIGDGAMVAYRRGASRLLGSADSGAFVGQTRFLDASYLQQHYPSSVSIAAIEHAEALILMTDGVSDPKFKSDADLSDPGCWDQLWQEIEPELAKENPEQALQEWLHFFERGYHDDRTLLISLVQADADKEQK